MSELESISVLQHPSEQRVMSEPIAITPKQAYPVTKVNHSIKVGNDFVLPSNKPVEKEETSLLQWFILLAFIAGTGWMILSILITDYGLVK